MRKVSHPPFLTEDTVVHLGVFSDTSSQSQPCSTNGKGAVKTYSSVYFYFSISHLASWVQQRRLWTSVAWCPPGLSCLSSMSPSETSGPTLQPSDCRLRTGPALERTRTAQRASSEASHQWGPCLNPALPPPSLGPQHRPSCCSPPALHAWTGFLSVTAWRRRGQAWMSKGRNKDIRW